MPLKGSNDVYGSEGLTQNLSQLSIMITWLINYNIQQLTEWIKNLGYRCT